MLIGDEYVCKLEEEMATILTGKISAYVDGVKMNKVFYQLALEHSFGQKNIEGEWQFTGYFNTPKGNVVAVTCTEQFIEDLERKAGMQVPLAMLGVVRFNHLGAKTPSALADARQAKIVAYRQS